MAEFEPPALRRDGCSRRRFIGMAAAGAAAACSLPVPARQPATPIEGGWEHAGEVIGQLREPEFASREFPITGYGAVADSGKDASDALAMAIADCHRSGGGRVVVPAGEFRCGPIHLLSNVNLHLESDSTLSFYTDPERYLPAVFTRWEGMELMNYSPLVYARGQQNIAVTGSGTLQGNADDATWWPWKGPHKERHWTLVPGQDQAPARKRLEKETEAGAPVAQRLHGDGSWLRPPMLQTYDCQRVLIEGVTIRNSPFWLIHPVLCEDVTVRNVRCISHGPNSDGCNPESCNRVLIEGCVFDTGDDCIAIKSGRNADGRRLGIPSQNIVIRDCEMRAGHGGVVIGSEISGGVRNVYAERCQMSSPELERALRIKTNSVRGGVLEHLYYRDITVGEVGDVLVINFHYEEGDAGEFDPLVRHVQLENVTVDRATRVFQVRGFARNPIRDLKLQNLLVRQAADCGIIEHVDHLFHADVSVNGKGFNVACPQLDW